MNLGPEYAKYRELYGSRYNPEDAEGLGSNIVDALKIGSGDKVLLKVQPAAVSVADPVHEQAIQRGAMVAVLLDDPEEIAKALRGFTPGMPQKEYRAMVKHELDVTLNATKLIGLFSNDNPRVWEGVDGEAMAGRQKARKPLRKASIGKRFFTFSLPTPEEAKEESRIEKISEPEYYSMVFRACNRPWNKIDQAHQILRELLRGYTYVEIHANEGAEPGMQTHLKMGIQGKIFAGSLFERNIGSELCSSPKRHTMTGRLAVLHPVMFQDRLLNNLRLDFEGGQVVDFWTEGAENMAWVKKILDITGAREVGELAFGTNSELTRPFLNRWLVEKIAGSAHLALGDSLRNKEFPDQFVNVDNRVRSDVHIDLPIVMLPAYGGGSVYAGYGKKRVKIAENGRWLDPRLAIISAK